MTEEKKVETVKRSKFADEKYLGTEPRVTEDSTQTELTTAYNWFNYFYTSEDAKSFTISYLKYIKYDRETIRKLASVKIGRAHVLNSSHSQQSRMPSSA